MQKYFIVVFPYPFGPLKKYLKRQGDNKLEGGGRLTAPVHKKRSSYFFKK